MTSILTNNLALTTLALMRGISASLEDTQTTAATGLKIKHAKDDPAYWSIDTTMRGDLRSIDTVVDALNMSKTLVDTAYNGMTAIAGLLTAVRDKVLLALDATEEGRTKLQTEIRALQETYVGIAKSASVAGQNWLYRNSLTQRSTVALVTGAARLPDGTFAVQSKAVDLTKVLLIDSGPNVPTIGILTRNYSATGGTSFVYVRHGYVRNFASGMIGVAFSPTTLPATVKTTLRAQASIAEAMMRDVQGAAAELGALSAGIDRQHELITRLGDVQRKSLGMLVDADMGETSSRLRALQARQDLAIQGLGIANARPAMVLQLFR